jgi:XapX domain-containing protein
MRVVLGFALAFIIGAVCRIVRIPSPAPQALMGSLLVVPMSLGYITETQFISHGGEKSCK